MTGEKRFGLGNGDTETRRLGKSEEIAGEADKGPDVGNEHRERVHEVGNSYALTLALVLVLAVCAAGPGTAGWGHIGISAGYYGVLFAFSSWTARCWGGWDGILARTVFMESRLAIVVIGVAAIGFRSPVLLEIAPDVVAVAIAGSGLADGTALGLEARRRDCSVVRALVGLALNRKTGGKVLP